MVDRSKYMEPASARSGKLHLVHQRVLSLSIGPVDIQCIEVDAAVRGNGQHLATQRLDQLTELTLRVQDPF